MKKFLVFSCSTLLLGSGAAMQAQQAYQYWLHTDAAANELRLGFFAPIETQVVKGLPYSAEVVTEFVQTLADGNRIVRRNTARVYRDGQGRMRREEDSAAGHSTITIMDPVAGTAYTLDTASRTARETSPVMIDSGAALNRLYLSASTLRLANLDWASPQASYRIRGSGERPGNETSEEKLPDRVMEGVLATGTRRTTTIPKGAIGNELPIKIVSDEWRSPELQILVLTDLNDPRAGRTTYRLLKISRLEPDVTLFQVPADYTIQRLPAGGRGRGRGGQN
jgi:hypothetical protein